MKSLRPWPCSFNLLNLISVLDILCTQPETGGEGEDAEELEQKNPNDQTATCRGMEEGREEGLSYSLHSNEGKRHNKIEQGGGGFFANSTSLIMTMKITSVLSTLSTVLTKSKTFYEKQL